MHAYHLNHSISDSLGTEETLGRGGLQFMTAGRGVTHSEHNRDVSNPLRFIQIWINTLYLLNTGHCRVYCRIDKTNGPI